jgi:hypothetical protein
MTFGFFEIESGKLDLNGGAGFKLTLQVIDLFKYQAQQKKYSFRTSSR